MALLTRIVAFLNTVNPAESRAFYEGVLGFRLVSDDDFALAFDANGTRLRIVKARAFTPAHGTVLGWEVDDVHAAIVELIARGVVFEQFNMDFMKQDEHGVWTTPNGDQVAWFRDPDRNLLSISRHA